MEIPQNANNALKYVNICGCATERASIRSSDRVNWLAAILLVDLFTSTRAERQTNCASTQFNCASVLLLLSMLLLLKKLLWPTDSCYTHSHRWHSAVLFCRVFSTWRKRMEPWFSQLERAHFVCRSENFPYMFEFRSKSALKYFCWSLIKLVYKMYSTKRTHFSNYTIPFYRPSVDCESAKIRNFSFHCRRWWPILV